MDFVPIPITSHAEPKSMRFTQLFNTATRALRARLPGTFQMLRMSPLTQNSANPV